MATAPLTRKPITCFSDDLRGFAFWSTQTQWLGQNGLYITSQRQTQADVEQYRPYFETIEKVADVLLQRGGVIVEVLQVYRCQKLLKPYPRPYV